MEFLKSAHSFDDLKNRGFVLWICEIERMNFFRLRGPDCWGDYGHVLIAGIVHSVGDHLLLSRTGPFVPPIAFPKGNMILSDSFRSELESMNGISLNFREVTYRKIVELAWENWDRTADAPSVSTGSSPEDILFYGQHSLICKHQMERSWEVLLPRVGKSSVELTENGAIFAFDSTDWNGESFFMSNNQNFVFASGNGLQLLSDVASEWVVSDRVETLPAREI